MPYDLHLADRRREVLEGLPGVEEKKMFGGYYQVKRHSQFSEAEKHWCSIVQANPRGL
jgi:hypothetical protein